jgi:hypothetical protein
LISLEQLLTLRRYSTTEAFIAENESATIAISQLNLLSELMLDVSQQALNPFEHPRFWAIQHLRSEPLPIEKLANSAPPSPTALESKSK